jgi:hypothetical protein
MQSILECSKCGVRGSIGTMKKCSQCRTNFYCSRTCQREDWKLHRPLCVSNTALKRICRALQQEIPLIVNDALKLRNITPWAKLKDIDIYLDTVNNKENFLLQLSETLQCPESSDGNMVSKLVDRRNTDYLHISITAMSLSDCINCAIEIPLFCFK